METMTEQKNYVCNGGDEKQIALDVSYFFHQYIFNVEDWTSKSFYEIAGLND